ncbi:MATE family efflux transporter [Balneola vulgaris]|uniref:MATE family efflux transporter n=1 Tax=Balneola vulgaris TaxID=287535 RepID=UPI000361F14C|nr:MATE family efflux transporter [Balneola vulgaris]
MSQTTEDQNTELSFWSDIKSSLSGSTRDFTKGSISRAILVLSIPMVLEMLMESIFAIVDIFFVSKLGAEAIATVGITESLLTLIYAVAIGFSMATTAVIARRIGEKNNDAASITAVQAIAVALIVSTPIALLGGFFAPELLSLMGAEGDIITEYSVYTSILFSTNSVIMLIFIINAIFRGAGDATVAMHALWIANGINIILDPILIFGFWIIPEMGIKGAAIATSIGRGIGVCFQLYKLFDGKTHINLMFKHLQFRWDIMWNLIKVSLGGIGQFIVATSSWIGLVRIIAVFGSVSLAGYTIAVRILIFSILPSWGMSNAAATLVGQNLGANQPERAEKSTWITAIANMIFLGLLGVIIFFNSEFLMSIFTLDPAVIEIGSQCLRIMSLGYIAYAFGMIITQAFNGSGDTLTPTLINLICFWIVEIPLAYYLALIVGLDEKGVFYSIIIAETLLAIIGYILFKRGTWKLTKV